MKNRLLLFDTETTGISKLNSHIWQLTAAKVDLNNWPDEKDLVFFNAHIKPPGYPNIEFDEKAAQKTGITFEALSKFHNPEFVMEHWFKFLEIGEYGWNDRYIPVAYNAYFDMDFYIKMSTLTHTRKQTNQVLFSSALDIFTYLIAYFRTQSPHTQPKSFKLFDVCTYFNINTSDLTAHDAKSDIIALYRLIKTMIDMKLIFNFIL